MEKTVYSRLLAAAMERANTNPYALSGTSGVPQPTIHRILTGETKEPGAGTLAKLADALGCDVSRLIRPSPEGAVREDRGDYGGRRLTPQERIVLDLFCGLTESQQREKIRELEADKSHNDALLNELVRRRTASRGGST